ncbi:TRAP transporter permease [Oceanibacterium hippocampi]|uniref:Sialic acid TRAP transporter permease protein SiaT n=1 Tax=Oceanibacterium hippocampi TaxID=745714 RepID=A0A1Y5TSX7_9PROT|nr:TRAP transporter fused permease subunit [Oceanibacterium hippocampi]SLN70682.1 Sialic acid TRAP transporter permease protein SiaT [Oceanibacterium hippocampi]
MPVTDSLAKACGLLAAALGLGLALQAIYSAYFGVWEPWFHRSLVVGISVAVVTLTTSLVSRHKPKRRLVAACLIAIDVAIIAVVTLALERLFNAYEHVDDIMLAYSAYDLTVSLLAVLAIFELSRRLFGWPLFLFSLLILVYCLYGDHFPWIFRHSGFSLEQTMQILWFGLQGVFGMPTGVVLQIIFIFIVFGVLLEQSGAGAALIRIAFFLTGRSRGGPAQAAVVASALFGTMSGSVVANVVGTGSFTIPMVKKRGFSGPFAGGVESAASAGGQFVPPVMGAAAFVMADLTGYSYLSICIAALVPALLFYLSLALSVGLEARRLGIRPTPAEDLVTPNRRDWLNGLMVAGPIAAIIIVLTMGRTAAMAGFWATVTVLVLAFLINPDFRRKPGRVLGMLAAGGRTGATIVIAVAGIGVVLGVLNLTGFGLKFASLISVIGEGNLFLSLLLTMLACLALGMGMPTLPAYLIIVLVMGPAIRNLGVPVLALHMFVLYFGVLSAITPPVALAAFAAAPIAGANPFTTALVAAQLSVAGFIIPFVFVYEPDLLLILDFDLANFVWVMVRFGAALWLTATAFAGFERLSLAPWSRIGRLLCAALILPGFIPVSLAACGLGALIVAYDMLLRQKFAPRETLASGSAAHGKRN